MKNIKLRVGQIWKNKFMERRLKVKALTKDMVFWEENNYGEDRRTAERNLDKNWNLISSPEIS